MGCYSLGWNEQRWGHSCFLTSLYSPLFKDPNYLKRTLLKFLVYETLWLKHVNEIYESTDRDTDADTAPLFPLRSQHWFSLHIHFRENLGLQFSYWENSVLQACEDHGLCSAH